MQQKTVKNKEQVIYAVNNTEEEKKNRVQCNFKLNCESKQDDKSLEGKKRN